MKDECLPNKARLQQQIGKTYLAISHVSINQLWQPIDTANYINMLNRLKNELNELSELTRVSQQQNTLAERVSVVAMFRKAVALGDCSYEKGQLVRGCGAG